MTTSKPFIIFSMLIASLSLFTISVQSVELDVGGNSGSTTPKQKNDQLYNDWASSNRFKVNDTLRFKYEKDSVMVVGEEEYERCRSSHPMFFSNSGDTAFTVDRPGLFYFISGVSGHCEKGLKMIVKVLEPAELEPPSKPSNTTTHKISGVPKIVLPTGIALCLVVGSFFM